MTMRLFDIAARSGVSISTVSRVINGSAVVSAAKRERVLSLLEKEKPRPRVRSRKSRRETLGILLLDGAELNPRVLITKLYSILLKLPNRVNLQILPLGIHVSELEARYFKEELQGIFILGHGGCSQELLHSLQRMPHVWLNSHFLSQETETVLLGNEFAGRLAARYLLENHCRRPAVVCCTSINPGFKARIDGFRFECFSKSVHCVEIPLELPEGSRGLEHCSSEQLDERLAALQKGGRFRRLDGIFTPEDRLVALLHCCFRRFHVRHLPRLVSCNYTPEYLDGLYPRPASIDLGAKTLVDLALEELLRQIAGGERTLGARSIIAPPELIPGDPL